MKKNVLIVLLIILIICLIGMVAYYFLTKPEETKLETNTITNETPLDNDIYTGLPSSFKLTKEQYPKIDGATAMYPMSVEIAKSVIGLKDKEAATFITHNTTAKAYENLISKKADLIFVSEPSEDILNQAKEKNVEFEMVGIGRDAFVFLVNQSNVVENLNIEQIQDIYEGKIKDWKEVGGTAGSILAYQREKNSGSQNLMEKLVMQGRTMMEAPHTVVNTMDELIDTIAEYDNSQNAIGYSIYLYAKEQYVKNNVKFLKINGIEATEETIANGTYPLSKIVYAIYRKDEPQDSNVRKLVQWLKTEEGQKVVEKGGYVKLK